MKEYQVVSEFVLSGERVTPPATVRLSDDLAAWGRTAGVIGAEVGAQKAAKGKKA